jgi:Zn-finger nucleic acid-binding protein
MKTCPVCQDTELTHGFLETGLPAYECHQCGGIWISANEYLTWVLVQELSATIKPAPDNSLPIPDTNQAILCPDCGRILRRYKIWPDIDFHLDRCGGCNGVWFDKNEWQVLKLNGLHNQINHFFTESWQRKLREEETRRRFEKMYREKFGPEDYAEVKRIKTWLTHHPLGSSLLAYLADQRPYRG